MEDISAQILAHVPCPIFWKDKEGYFLGCNNIFLQTFGLNNYKQIIGKKDLDLPWNKYSAQYSADDSLVIETGEIITRIENIPLRDRIMVSRTTKAPLYQGKEIIGVLGVCDDITDSIEAERLRMEIEAQRVEARAQQKFQVFIQEIQSIINNYKINDLKSRVGESKSVKVLNTDIQLTKREREVLYFLSLNKSPKEIANIIARLENKKISPSSIQSIIDKQLYPKFNAYSISQLVETAVVLKLIPFLL